MLELRHIIGHAAMSPDSLLAVCWLVAGASGKVGLPWRPGGRDDGFRSGLQMSSLLGWANLNRYRREDGFRCYSSSVHTEADMGLLLLAIAKKLGAVLAGRHGRLVEPIIPSNELNAERESLSALHGLGELPMHIDTGHYLRPARFLLIGCVAPGSSGAKTRLADTHKIRLTADQLALLRSAPLLVRSGRRSFYSTVVDRRRSYFRYDTGCMEAVDQRGEAAMATMRTAVAGLPVELHEWRAGDVLMIDNWRMLHGRTASAADERLLLRVSVR